MRAEAPHYFRSVTLNVTASYSYFYSYSFSFGREIVSVRGRSGFGREHENE